MDKYLRPTKYCDCDHPELRFLVEEIRARFSDPVDLRVRLYNFVRDEVLYYFTPWKERASETLQARRGTCTNKANLLVALFRASGIPAGYGRLTVNPREYFGPIAPPAFKPLLAERSAHFYVRAFHNDRWIKLDPATDSAISSRLGHLSKTTRAVVWDGTSDAMDAIDPDHIYTDEGPFEEIDDDLEKPPRNATLETLMLLNSFVDFIRRSPPFQTSSALLEAYLNWPELRAFLERALSRHREIA